MSEGPNPGAGLPESAWPPGLHAGQKPEELVFVLPGMRDDELRYTIESGEAIASLAGNTALELAKVSVKVAFPGAGSIAVDIVEALEESVPGAGLFECVTAHMLDTVGDAHTAEAIRVLREAISEPDPRGKQDLRNRAATILHVAYSEQVKLIEVKTEELSAIGRSQLVLWSKTSGPAITRGHQAVLWPKIDAELKKYDEITAVHEKAAGRAIAIALINRQMGLMPAALNRVSDADNHWANYYHRHINRADLVAQSLHSKALEQLMPKGFGRVENWLTADWDAQMTRLIKVSKLDPSYRKPRVRDVFVALERAHATKQGYLQLAASLRQPPQPPPMKSLF